MQLEETVREIGKKFGITPEELNLDLGRDQADVAPPVSAAGAGRGGMRPRPVTD